MKMTDSPAPMLVMPVSNTPDAAELDSSSIFQPVMSIASVPVLVTSNQSAAYGVLPLPHGATSVMKMVVGTVGVSLTTSVIASVNATVASGVEPTVGSSTSTVTL